MNKKEIANTIECALEAFDLAQSPVFDGVGGLDALAAQGLVFSVTTTAEGVCGLSVSFEGDVALAWRGPLSSFSAAEKRMAAERAAAIGFAMLAS